MINNAFIETFLDSVLTPQLRRTRLSEEASLLSIRADVRARLLSLLARAKDQRFRAVALFPAVEEAFHYQPADAPLHVRTLVAATIRNSRIEDFHAGPKLVSQAEIRSINEEAIQYFQQIDWPDAEGITPDDSQDPFSGLVDDFPASAHALATLSTMKGRASEYDAVCARMPELSVPKTPLASGAAKMATVVVSGMDSSFDPALASALMSLAQGKAESFFSPSFKHITRHPRKLLTILEWLLAHDKAFVSPNYFISNGYVAARGKPIQPITYTPDLGDVLRQRAGLSKRHADALRGIERHVK